MSTTVTHTSDEIFAQVAEMAADLLGIEASEISRESNLVVDFEADSLDLVELTINAKSKFGVPIPKEDLGDLMTIGAVVDYVFERQS